MVGNYTHSIDSKSRMSLPSKLRKKLGDTVYLAKVFDDCITVYSEDGWALFMDKIKDKPRSFRFGVNDSAIECDIDAQGRVVLPAKLREYAALENEAVISGQNTHVEIWNPARHAEKLAAYQEYDAGDIQEEL